MVYSPRTGLLAAMLAIEAKMTARRALPNRRNGLSFEFIRTRVAFIVTLGLYDDGRPGEVFVSCDKTTTESEALGRDAAIMISIALQHGATLATMRHAVTRGRHDEPTSFIGALLDEIEARCDDLPRGDEPEPVPMSSSPKPLAPAGIADVATA